MIEPTLHAFTKTVSAQSNADSKQVSAAGESLAEKTNDAPAKYYISKMELSDSETGEIRGYFYGYPPTSNQAALEVRESSL